MAAKSSNRKRRGRGEGGVSYDEQRKLWIGSVSLGYDADGKRIRPVIYGATKQEVLASLAKLRAEHGVCAPDPGRMTVVELLTRWQNADEGLSPTTKENREISCRLHVTPRVGHLLLANLTPLAVSNFYARMRREGVGGPTAQTAGQCLAAALNLAVALHLLGANPASGVTLPSRGKREMAFLTAQQSKALLTAAKGRWLYPLLACALGSGCRQGEMLALTWDALDLKTGTLAVRHSLAWTKATGFVLKEPKTASGRRTVSLPAFAVEALAVHRAAQLKAGLISCAVFCSPLGNYRKRADVKNTLRRIVAKANADSEVLPLFRFHDLRHSVASLLLSQGQSLRAVSQRLGHADPATCLRIYAHCMPGDDARLATGLQEALG